MRQTVLVLLLVFVIVLSAHFAQMTRANQRAERLLHDTPIAALDGREYGTDDDGDTLHAIALDHAIAAAKD